jgi:hypothetical protein
MAKKKQTEFQITIGYRAVLCMCVKADNEEQAKQKVLAEFEKVRHFNKLDIQDDSFRVDGVLNMDETYNMLYK